MQDVQVELSAECKALQQEHLIAQQRLTAMQNDHRVLTGVLRQLLALKAAADTNSASSNAYTQLSAALDDAGRPKVLVADPDERASKKCRRVLSQAGCDVCVVSDGMSAVAQAQTCSYDLILIATVDGASVCEVICGFNNKVPVVGVSEPGLDVEGWYQRGAIEVLQRPCTREALGHLVNTYLRKGATALLAATASEPGIKANGKRHGEHIMLPPPSSAFQEVPARPRTESLPGVPSFLRQHQHPSAAAAAGPTRSEDVDFGVPPVSPFKRSRLF